MGDLRIGQIAERAGVRPSAIRYYEAQGLLPKAARRGGQRIYDSEVLQRLAVIELAKDVGFTIAEMRSLLRGLALQSSASQRWRKLASSKMEEIDRRIARARRMREVLEAVSGCDCPTLSDCARMIGDVDPRVKL